MFVLVAEENEQRTPEHAQSQWMAGWAHQQREAELLHELAGHTIDQAQPETRFTTTRFRPRGPTSGRPKISAESKPAPIQPTDPSARSSHAARATLRSSSGGRR
jgi:hypothetical protein